MFEHVGVNHYATFFRKVRDLLTDDGVALIHTIGRSEPPTVTNPFIAKYIFPGGYIPALSEMVAAIERSGLIITDLEILRLHYAETLRAWRERFLANWDKAAAILDETFCRMWEFYLAGSETAFRYQNLVVFQVQLVKRIRALPITRDYMFTDERRLRRAGGRSRPGRAWPANRRRRRANSRDQSDFSGTMCIAGMRRLDRRGIGYASRHDRTSTPQARRGAGRSRLDRGPALPRRAPQPRGRAGAAWAPSSSTTRRTTASRASSSPTTSTIRCTSRSTRRSPS